MPAGGEGTVDIDDLHSGADGWRRGEPNRGGVGRGSLPAFCQDGRAGWNQMAEGGMVTVAGRGIKVAMLPSKAIFFFGGSISRPISPP